MTRIKPKLKTKIDFNFEGIQSNIKNKLPNRFKV